MKRKMWLSADGIEPMLEFARLGGDERLFS
jgi:hypothetical protein